MKEYGQIKIGTNGISTIFRSEEAITGEGYTIDISTPEKMESFLNSSNFQKAIRYIGTTQNEYIKNNIYFVVPDDEAEIKLSDIISNPSSLFENETFECDGEQYGSIEVESTGGTFLVSYVYGQDRTLAYSSATGWANEKYKTISFYNTLSNLQNIWLMQNSQYADAVKYLEYGTNIATPINIATEQDMASLLISDNVGKVYRFTGTTGTYINGDLYIVEDT